MKKWEYAHLERINLDDRTYLKSYLDGMGEDGWELVSASVHEDIEQFYFKRPLR
jgi:hypothetical protein